MKKAFMVCLGITILELIAAAVSYPFLPGQIPTHWGVSGIVDGYGDRYMIFLAPVISLVATLGLYFMPKIDPKGENIKRSGKSYPAVMILLNAVMVTLLCVTLLTSFGYAVPVNMVIPAAIGIMFIIMGNYMPKVKPNYFFGIRLPWTLADETVWHKTHRFGAWCFAGMGLLFLLGILLPPPFNFIAPISGIFIGLAAMTLYSYAVYKKIAKQK